jgi:hypothetical protein
MVDNNYSNQNAESSGVPAQFRETMTATRPLKGLYVAKVTHNLDETYQGHIYVEIVGHDRISEKEDVEERKRFYKVRRVLPYGGMEHQEEGKYSSEFGMSSQPPSVGTFVMVAFTGDYQEGFLLGVLPDHGRNTQIPGLPANEILNENQTLGVTFDSGVLHDDTTEKNRHPQFESIEQQGLKNDSVRGLGSSGGRRESPSNVFGFSSMGGHSFVMDDGTVANEEGVSLSPDPGRQEGKNRMIRMRSRDGAQFLINDTWGIIYITTQKGNAWIQLDDEGHIDVHSEMSLNVHAAKNINFYAGETFSVDADSVQIKARGADGMKLHTTTGEFNLHSAKDLQITTDLNMNLRAGPHMKLTADLIDINGPPARPATKTTTIQHPDHFTLQESINDRVPQHEPWVGHAEDPVVDKVAVQANIDLQRRLSDYQLPSPVSTNKAKTVTKTPSEQSTKGSGSGTQGPVGPTSP